MTQLNGEYGVCLSNSGVSKVLNLNEKQSGGQIPEAPIVTNLETINSLDKSKGPLREEEQIGKIKPRQENPDLKAGEENVMPKKTWATLFSGNWWAENGMNLAYIPPTIVDGKIVVQLDRTEVEKEAEKWLNALIVYVIGEALGYNTMS